MRRLLLVAAVALPQAANAADRRQAEGAGQHGLGLKSRPNPLQPGSFPKQPLEEGTFLTSLASLDAQDHLAGEVVEVTGGGLLVAFKCQQTSQLLEVLGVLTHTHCK